MVTERPESDAFRAMEGRIDRLTGLLHRFGLCARVLHGGALRGAPQFERRAGLSRLQVNRLGCGDEKPLFGNMPPMMCVPVSESRQWST